MRRHTSRTNRPAVARVPSAMPLRSVHRATAALGRKPKRASRQVPVQGYFFSWSSPWSCSACAPVYTSSAGRKPRNLGVGGEEGSLRSASSRHVATLLPARMACPPRTGHRRRSTSVSGDARSAVRRAARGARRPAKGVRSRERALSAQNWDVAAPFAVGPLRVQLDSDWGFFWSLSFACGTCECSSSYWPSQPVSSVSS